MVQRAVCSQARLDLGSWCGQNQSRPVRVGLCWRKADVVVLVGAFVLVSRMQVVMVMEWSTLSRAGGDGAMEEGW